MLGYVVKFRAEKENVIPQLSQADTQDKVLSIYVYNRRLEWRTHQECESDAD